MTDRTIRTRDDVSTLDFEKSGGLLPLVAQDARTGDVLMLGFADAEAVGATIESGEVHFHSRSRGRLWKKGETSGNTLTLVSLHTDCDADALLARVDPAGPACHTKERTCFGEVAEGTAAVEGMSAEGGEMGRLARTISARASERPEGSYTTRLLSDRNLRLKKLGEETAELVTALATDDADRAAEEAADLIYHVLVALQATGRGLDDVEEVLRSRAG